jgi:hypothetical protein
MLMDTEAHCADQRKMAAQKGAVIDWNFAQLRGEKA